MSNQFPSKRHKSFLENQVFEIIKISEFDLLETPKPIWPQPAKW